MSSHRNPGQYDKFHEMRWSMCVAYYVPMGMAGKLIYAVVNTTNKNAFKSPDVFLRSFHTICSVFIFWAFGFWLLAASCQSLVASSQSSIAKFTTFATQ
jgi:hypothetical protein